MTEENRETPKLETIVREMGNIFNLTRNLNRYDRAKDPSEYAHLLDSTVQILSGAKPGEPNYGHVLSELEVDRGSAYIKVEGSRDLRAQTINDTYEARKDEIVGSIVEKLNKSLEGAKDRIDAIRKVNYAFSEIFAQQLPNPTQEDVNHIAKDRLMKLTQMPIMTKSVEGNIGLIRDLAYRELVNEYLVEAEKDGAKTYTINTEKLAELADHVVAGSILYTAQPPKEKK